MNLLLLEPADFISDSKVTLGGRRLQHLLEVQRVSEGTSLRAQAHPSDGRAGSGIESTPAAGTASHTLTGHAPTKNAPTHSADGRHHGR